jgi:hypothetical protein
MRQSFSPSSGSVPKKVEHELAAQFVVALADGLGGDEHGGLLAQRSGGHGGAGLGLLRGRGGAGRADGPDVHVLL